MSSHRSRTSRALSLLICAIGAYPAFGQADAKSGSLATTRPDPTASLKLPRDPIPDRVSIRRALKPKEKHTYATLDGPGCIRHIWLVPTRSELGSRQTIIRIYFDGATTPHVEAPVGDFFGVMHGKKFYPVNTQYLAASAESGYNCYFAMPFAKEARIEFEAGDEGNTLYMQVDWHRYPDQKLEEPMRFCSRWRRELPTKRYDEDYLVLDADGPGRLLGFFYGVRLMDDVDRWSHGGGDNIYIDGEGDHPAYLRGIGGEDTFGTGYGGALHSPPETNLYQGMPYYVHEDSGEARPAQRLVGYRWFVHDAVPFKESIQFRFGCMRNDICSTVYWYQTRTVRPFFEMPKSAHITALPRRFNLIEPADLFPRGTYDLPLPDRGTWWLCGPFSNDDGKAMSALLPAEKTFDAKAVFATAHEAKSPYLTPLSKELGRDQARWVKRAAQHGFIDFNHVFRCAAIGAGAHHPAVAVARCILNSPEETKAILHLTWDDHVVLRVNDSSVDLGSQASFRTKTTEVSLKKGANVILLKLDNTSGSNHGGWAFSFRATTAAGQTLLPKAE